MQGGWTPSRPFAPAFGVRPEHLSGLDLQQLLVELVAALPLGHPEFAGADVGDGEAPTLLVAHHRTEPVVAAGAQHPLLQHRAWSQNPGDLPFQQGRFSGAFAAFSRLFHLVAEGHAEAAAHQLRAVALGRVMGNARHWHPPDRFAPFFSRQGQFQQPREGNRVLEKALEEVTEPVEQDPLGMLRFQFDVVAQHRCELLPVHKAVVVPGG